MLFIRTKLEKLLKDMKVWKISIIKKELIEIENKKFNSRRCKVSERTET